MPLTSTGLSLNIVLRSGIFNIGADGAFDMGAGIATAIAIGVPATQDSTTKFVLIVAAGIAGGSISMLPVPTSNSTEVDPTVLSMMFNSVFY